MNKKKKKERGKKEGKKKKKERKYGLQNGLLITEYRFEVVRTKLHRNFDQNYCLGVFRAKMLTHTKRILFIQFQSFLSENVSMVCIWDMEKSLVGFKGVINNPRQTKT